MSPVAKPVVADTTPLITLGEVGLLPLLQTFYTMLWIPQAVFDEYQYGVPRFSQRPDLKLLAWITLRPAPHDPDVPASLDPGESEAIALARAAQARLLLIDEQRGRAAAIRLGLNITGFLGILVEAKKSHHIALVRPYLDMMIAQGRRIGPKLRDQILAAVGE